MKLFNQKGFTIVELIVVIAIIAVLATIVLVNVTGYINKSRDAAIKGNLDSVLVNAAAWYDSHSASYASFNGDTSYTGIATAVTNAGKTATFVPSSPTTDFCVWSTMYDTTAYPNGYCVDSTGFKGARASSSTCVGTTHTCN